MADDSVQPVPWVFGGDALGREPRHGVRLDQQIDALVAVPWPPLISTARAPSASSRSRLDRHFALVCATGASSSAAASGRLGVITSARGMQLALRRRSRPRRQQAVAGGRDHHRVEHDVAAAGSGEALRDRRDAAACDSMPIFTASTSRSENTASICAVMKSGRHVVDAGHALRCSAR